MKRITAPAVPVRRGPTRLVSTRSAVSAWSAGAYCFALALAGLAVRARLETGRCRQRLAQALILARTDELTGLGNRRALLDRLNATLATSQPAGLILLDLDGFKTVNDTYGHDVGDQVLRAVAGRLIQAAGHQATEVTRLGGDEFAVLTRQEDPELLRSLAGRIHAALARPVQIGLDLARDQNRRELDILIGVSIGVTVRVPGDALGVDLLCRADRSMYQAKPTSSRTDRCPARDDTGPVHAQGQTRNAQTRRRRAA